MSVPDIETAAVPSYSVIPFTYGHENLTAAPLILVAPNTPAILKMMYQAERYLQTQYKLMIPFEDEVGRSKGVKGIGRRG